MIDEGIEVGKIFTQEGKPQFFKLDKKVPVEMASQELKVFNEVEYLSSIADFISKNLDCKYEDLIEEYGGNDFNKIISKLTQILSDKLDMTDEEIWKTPRKKLLKKLYDIGCPQLYAFHKTAQKTGRYGLEHIAMEPNPLSLGLLRVATGYGDVTRYLREEDELPFIMAFPLGKVLEIEDKMHREEGYRKKDEGKDNLFEVEFIPFMYADDDQISAITGEMRVFSPDKERYKKFQKFRRSIKE